MTNRTAETSPLVYARVAGLAYVIIIILGVFGVGFVESRLIVPGNDAATVNNIMANELLFRIGIYSEIMMFALVILLSLALYVILKTVNRNLALLALLWRLAEAIIGGAVAVLSGLIPLLLLNGEVAFETEQLQALVGLFKGTYCWIRCCLDVHRHGRDRLLLSVFQVEVRSGNTGIWGILTYVSMLILSFVSILSSNLPETIKMAFYAPGALFEVIFGLWLLIKGVNAEQWEKRAPSSPKV